MPSLISIVSAVKGEIVNHGRAGCLLGKLMESHKLSIQLMYYIAKNNLLIDNFTFKLGELAVDIKPQSLEEFGSLLPKMTCTAPLNEIERHWGVETAGCILQEDSNLHEILESISGSAAKGCLVSETMKSSPAGTQVHGSIDKLLGLGLLVKKSILAASGPIRSRVSSKSTVVHSPKYSSFYDEVADGVRISAGNAYLDRVHDLILNALDQNNAKMMTVRDLARALGLSRWDVQALRNVTISQKEGGKVKFFEMLCQVFLKNGTLSSARLCWCVSRADVDPEASEDASTLFQCSRSLPLNEAIAAALSVRPEGLTAADIRCITGVPLKRAAKMFNIFSSKFGYPVEKVQIGKQLVHKLKNKPGAPVRVRVSSAVARMPAVAVAVHREPISGHASNTSCSGSSSSRSAQAMLSPSSRTAAAAAGPMSVAAIATSRAGVFSALPSEAPAASSVSVLKTEAADDGLDVKLSDRQQLHNQIILDFLAQEGNIATLSDVMNEVRAQHKLRQRLKLDPVGAGTVDRRTIERALHRLQYSLNLITVVESVDPLALDAGPMPLVILNEVSTSASAGPSNDGMGDVEMSESIDCMGLVARFWEQHALKMLKKQESDRERENEVTGSSRKTRSVRSAAAAPVGGKRKRKAAIVESDDSSSSAGSSENSSYNDSGSETEESEGDEEEEEEAGQDELNDDDEVSTSDSEAEPRVKKTLWGQDSPSKKKRGSAAAARGRGAAAASRAHGGGVILSVDPAVAAFAKTIPQELNKTHRNRIIKAKKTFEDFHIFTEVAPPGLEAAGWLVNAMRLHLQVVKTLFPTPVSVNKDNTSGKHSFTLSALLPSLPVSFLLNTSMHLRGLLAAHMALATEEAELNTAIDHAVTTTASIESIMAVQGLLGECVRQHMQSEEGRREMAGLVAALISVGILPLTSLAGEELRDSLVADMATMKATSAATAEASIHLLSTALGELEAGLKEISSASSSSSSNRSSKALSAQKTKQGSNITDVPAPPLALFVHSQQEGDRDLLQVTMRVFSWLAVLLNEHPNQPTPLRVVTLLWDQSHEASAMPVGAWQTVLAEVEVYHHWKTAVLPSLPICWENIQRIQRLTHMGRHCLHYHEVHSDHPPNAISADGGESSYFDGKVTMSHWTNNLIQSAWADTQALPWTCLRAQQSDEQKIATDASGENVQPRTGTFSLDMPRKGPTSQQRKRQLHNQQQHPQPQEGESSASKAPKAVSQNARKRSKMEANAAISKSKSNSAEDFAAEEEEEEDEFDEEGQALLLGLQLGLIPESEDEGQEESGIDNSGGGGGGGGKLSRHLLMDPCLEEEMQSLFASDDIEWSTSQVALVLEAVLIHFFARTYQGQLQSALLPTKTATQAALVTTVPASTAAAAVKPSASSVASVSAPDDSRQAHHPEPSSSISASASGSAVSPHPFVNTSTSSPPAPVVARRAAVTVEPANSCFDIDWADMDFSCVAEGFLSLAIAATKLPDHQKAAKLRLVQCVRQRPRLRDLVAFVACNKGARLSSTFRRIFNQILSLSSPTARAATPAKAMGAGGHDNTRTAARAALSSTVRVYASPVLNSAGLRLLQQHGYSAVSEATRELLTRGLLRRPDHCRNARCTAKPCPHKKRSFVVSDLFFESQTGVLSAPFYLDMLHRISPGAVGDADTTGGSAGGDGSAKRNGPKEQLLLSTHALLLALQQTSQHSDRLPFRALAVMHCLAAAPNRLSSRLSVQPSESLRFQTTTATFNARDASSAAVEEEDEENGAEQVLLLGQDAFEPHSGFCDKTLNSLRADFVLTATAPSAGSSTPSMPLSSATAGVPAGAREQQPDYPWLLPSGDENRQVLEAFCSKVLAVLSDKPGAGLRTLHTALMVLSAAHTEALLRLMTQRGLVRTRRTNSGSGHGPSLSGKEGSDLFGLGAAVFSPATTRTTTTATAAVTAGSAQEHICYFAANLIGLH